MSLKYRFLFTHRYDMLFQVLRRRINQRLSNKVVPELGLCICVYDLLEVGVTYILPGEGSGHTRVKVSDSLGSFYCFLSS